MSEIIKKADIVIEHFNAIQKKYPQYFADIKKTHDDYYRIKIELDVVRLLRQDYALPSWVSSEFNRAFLAQFPLT